ncbi:MULTISPECIES: VOC family protein [Priestia]|uniref:VOC family protein n=1 Tax=Priestia TaxID=2800373 RepID=UPI0008879AE7|nr:MULTISPECIES: VOC family protein [Priestia]MBK0005776.1 VOC family protein [Bacillus sp. S35]SDD29939.1 lactoylglutathione lyase [Priestia aryabhattai B8W22]MCM3252085.1 VOC family protein [Priestia aryabhattai]MCM3642204.1 VOC family protein [Priestia aryabhattai]PFW74648.1 VOC family protein [Priestia aryabhattai]
MIKKVGQIMVYVNDQDQAVKFWTEKMGFQVVSEQNNEQGMKWIELAPVTGAETTIILHNKQLIAKMQPELNVGTPSLLFFTENVDELYRDLTAKGVTVGEIVSMPSGRVFNFSDSEDNYFAVMENANMK